MYFIGDVHGLFLEYNELVRPLPCSLQLGDMGIGFGRDHLFPRYEQHRFIRGNHDNPALCRGLRPQYLGEFGYWEEHGIFHVSGAWSVDHLYRTEGKDWWREEELAGGEFSQALELYSQVRPRVVATHDCPFDVVKIIHPKFPMKTATGSFFDCLLEEHLPELWVFAHHHREVDLEHRGVHFRGLGEMNVWQSRELGARA